MNKIDQEFRERKEIRINWNKLSTISIWSAFLAFVIHTFLRQYVEKYWVAIFIIEITCLLLFLISEIIKFVIRIKMRNKKKEY
jgi:hypothetical protein